MAITGIAMKKLSRSIRFWMHRASLIGVSGDAFSMENRRTQAANLMAISSVLISIPFYILNVNRLLAYFFFPTFWLLLASVLWQNSQHRHKSARLTLVLTLMTLFYALACALHVPYPVAKQNFMTLIVASSSSALVLFSYKSDRWLLLLIMLLAFTQIVAFPFIDPLFELYTPGFTAMEAWIRSWLIVALSLSLIFLFFGFYQSIARKGEDQVRSLLLQTQDMNHDLQVKEEEIRQYADELKTTNEKLSNTLGHIEIQSNLLAKQHEGIIESINYARRIQTAILPPDALVQALLPSSWVYYRPRDIVSGDFYWVHSASSQLFIAIVDCTGHGVPGAFMSVMAYSLLNQIMSESEALSPAVLLAELDARVRQTLRQQSNADSMDGMDMALVSICADRRRLRFAGAGRPLYAWRDGQFAEWSGVKLPVGGAQHERKVFTEHEITLRPGDRFYLFTDGITDQFGMVDGHKRKFTPRRLREWIASKAESALPEQQADFVQLFEGWQEGQEQLDDQTLFAFSLDA